MAVVAEIREALVDYYLEPIGSRATSSADIVYELQLLLSGNRSVPGLQQVEVLWCSNSSCIIYELNLLGKVGRCESGSVLRCGVESLTDRV